MEKHWEMLRWVVSFMDENAAKWSERKQERGENRWKRDKEEERSLKSRAEKMRELQEEEELVRGEKRSNKDERYKEVARLKRSWRELKGGEKKEEEPWVTRR